MSLQVQALYKNDGHDNASLLQKSHAALRPSHLDDQQCLILANAILNEEFQLGDVIPRGICIRMLERSNANCNPLTSPFALANCVLVSLSPTWLPAFNYPAGKPAHRANSSSHPSAFPHGIAGPRSIMS